MHKMDQLYREFQGVVFKAKDICSEGFAEDICINCKFNTTPGEFRGFCLLITNYFNVEAEKPKKSI